MVHVVPVAHVVYVALTHVPDQSVHVVLWVASTVFKHLFHVDVEPLVDVEAAMVLDIDQKPTQLEGPRDLVILDEVTMLHPLPPREVHLEVPPSLAAVGRMGIFGQSCSGVVREERQWWKGGDYNDGEWWYILACF